MPEVPPRPDDGAGGAGARVHGVLAAAVPRVLPIASAAAPPALLTQEAAAGVASSVVRHQAAPAPRAAARSPLPVAATEGAVNVPAAPAIEMAGEIDGQALVAYRLALAGAARQLQRDMPTADAWSGTARVQVKVSLDGTAPQVTLLDGSGQAALDRAALALVEQAARQARIPIALRNRTYAVTVAVSYGAGE